MSEDTPAVLLDLDGTLVDSVYHHVVAWGQAFREAGYTVPLHRIHAGIGLGSDRLLPWLLGSEPDDGDELRDAHKELFLAAADELVPTVGALDLLDDLERREVPFLVATSASTDEREALLEALGRTDLDTTDSDDVATSKPGPDLLLAAAEQLDVDPLDVTMIGDSPWDAEAAVRLEMRAFAVRTGGFGDDVLRAAGASRIVDAPRDLIGLL
jgi:HAD superfamily hydrolase (TIGR01549 family)